MELRSLEDWVLLKQFKSVPNVVDVSDFGGTVREYQVRVDPNKLVSYGLSIGQVEQQLANNNINAGGSFVEEGMQQMNVRALGLFSTVHDIEQTVLKTQTGTALRVKDIADWWPRAPRSGWATWPEPTTWRTGASSTSRMSFRAGC
jgi:cobalt-zinc-cadmium resistance protein CzcA